MTELPPSLIEARHGQMFPTLAPADIVRVRRFGEVRTYRQGQFLARIGEVSPGMIVVLAGEVTVTHHTADGGRHLIVTHRPGSFLGELAQLSGRPSLVDAEASAPGRPASPRRSMRRPRACRCWCWTATPSAARPALRCGSRTIWDFPPGSPAWR